LFTITDRFGLNLQLFDIGQSDGGLCQGLNAAVVELDLRAGVPQAVRLPPEEVAGDDAQVGWPVGSQSVEEVGPRDKGM
jgi:hypothetical protein